MQVGGNSALNSFLAQYGIPKETDIVAKYNSKAAAVYRDRIQALAEGRSWNAPPVVKESVGTGNQGGGRASTASTEGGGTRATSGWDDWDEEPSRGSGGSGNIRRHGSDSSIAGAGGNGPPRSHSSGDIYTKSQLEQSAAGKDAFFARKQMENASRPDNLPPSQGGKYVGFGSGGGRPPQARGPPAGADVLNDSVTVLTQVHLSRDLHSVTRAGPTSCQSVICHFFLIWYEILSAVHLSLLALQVMFGSFCFLVLGFLSVLRFRARSFSISSWYCIQLQIRIVLYSMLLLIFRDLRMYEPKKVIINDFSDI